MISSLKLILTNTKPQKNSPTNINLKGKFDWLNSDKFEDLIKTYQVRSDKNSPAGSPSSKSPLKLGVGAGNHSSFGKAMNNGGGGSPSNKGNAPIGLANNTPEKYNLKLEKIQEENVIDKKETVFEKINKLKQENQFVFKNSFNTKEENEKLNKEENEKLFKEENIKEEIHFEEGGSPNKSDYAMFGIKKDEFCFTNMLDNL